MTNNDHAAFHLLQNTILKHKGSYILGEDGDGYGRYVDADRLEDDMMPWSSGEKLLAHLVLDFCERSGHEISMDDLASRLDDDNWKAVIEALRIRREGPAETYGPHGAYRFGLAQLSIASNSLRRAGMTYADAGETASAIVIRRLMDSVDDVVARMQGRHD